MAGPVSVSWSEVESWPDEAWRRLIAAVTGPALAWPEGPRCVSCGRPAAEADCEPDLALCWSPVTGTCG